LEGLDGKNASEQIKMLTDRMSDLKAEITDGARPAFEAIKKGCS
jgi:hypothetical protein